MTAIETASAAFSPLRRNASHATAMASPVAPRMTASGPRASRAVRSYLRLWAKSASKGTVANTNGCQGTGRLRCRSGVPFS